MDITRPARLTAALFASFALLTCLSCGGSAKNGDAPDQQNGAEANQQSVGVELGEYAPLFSLSDQNGKTVSLADYRGQALAIIFYRGHW